MTQYYALWWTRQEESSAVDQNGDGCYDVMLAMLEWPENTFVTVSLRNEAKKKIGVKPVMMGWSTKWGASIL